jgi:hypothetical protein
LTSATSNPPARQDVHFLHISKTGGTAVKHALKTLPGAQSWLHLHRHETRLSDVPAGERMFFFLRDPVTRFVSSFYSRQRKGAPKYNRPWTSGETLAFSQFDTAQSLAAALSSRDGELRTNAVAAMRGIKHVKASYWLWLKSKELLRARAQDILFIGQQEFLESDFKVLAGLLGLDAGELPRDPVQAHRNPADVDRRLSDEAKENLRAWYQADYEAIQVCSEIARERRLGGSIAS